MAFRREVQVKNHTLLIREAEPSDALNMIDYINIVAGESNNIGFGPGEFDVPVEKEEKILEHYASLDNSIFLVGYIGDELVSVSNFSSSTRPRMRHTGEIGMSVLKKYWRHGIGEAMMRALIDWAIDTGIIRKMNLAVATYNSAGIALYKKTGFRIEGTVTREMMIDGEFVDTHHMGLEID